MTDCKNITMTVGKKGEETRESSSIRSSRKKVKEEEPFVTFKGGAIEGH